MNHTPAPLTVRGLGTSYGAGGDSAAWALRDVSFTIAPGRTLAVLGPSGCGKSTLLRLVAGLETPEAGEICLGDDVLSAPGAVTRPDRRGMSMVFQDYALWPHLRVREIIGYGLQHGVNRVPAAVRADRVAELLRLLRLEGLADRLPSQLSGGQQQRVAIARALATRPRLLLFDEPLSNLDAQLRMEMREELSVLLATLGTTALYVTHDVSEALALADEILVLHRGRAVQCASPQEVFQSPANGWVANLAGFSAALKLDGIVSAAGAEDIAIPADQRAAGIALGVLGAARIEGRYCGVGIASPGTPEAYLHPGAVSLADPHAAALSGTVTSCVFEGRHYNLRVQLAEAGTVTLAVPERIELGAKVGLAVDPQGVLLYGEEGAAVASSGA